MAGQTRLTCADARGSGSMTDREPARGGSRLPDALLALDQEYTNLLGLLDREAATSQLMARVPELTGVDVAWIGEPEGEDRNVLRHTVNTVTDGVVGLVVPHGCGLGGRVMLARRPLWVSDYVNAPTITHHFDREVEAERVNAMIAVPVIHENRVFGVLYGANRSPTVFGDRTAAAMERAASRAAAAVIVAERARHAREVAVHEERRRIALELHDTVGAMLFTIGAGIRRLGDALPADAEVRARLDTIEQQAFEAAATLRGSLRALSAPPEQVAVGVALRSDCLAFTQRTGIPARVITVTALPPLDCARVTALAGASREALLNVEKHASADSVVVTVFALRGGVAVTVSDDGVGLPGQPEQAGLGLAAATERLARLGGELTVGANDDGGVTVQAWVPQ
jgi:signal transduction histidine kinase